MIRLGLCCLFREASIKFRSTTATYLAKCDAPLDHVAKIADHNTVALQQAILYCAEHGIGAFRINSRLLPACTHPEVGYDIPSSCIEGLRACGELARARDIRLSFHPDQFVVLSSPDESVVEKSVRDLLYHTELAELVGADVINIHGGGGYGDKPAALKRFAQVFVKLPSEVQSRLTIENDDRVYTPADLLPLAKELAIPLCYDVHHHRFLKDGLSIEEASEAALVTWNREPLFHISSPLNKTSRHHDYIHLKDLPQSWKQLPDFTLDIEAKAKELAVEKLRSEMIEARWDVGG